MTKWLRNLAVLSVTLAAMIAGAVSNVNAAGFGDGHRFGADVKLITALGLSSQEQAALTSAVTTYGPAVKTAMQTFHAAKKQLKTDLAATTPVGSQLVADATALANAKTQLKTARAQLGSALSSALTPAHLQQFQAELTAQFQRMLDKKTDRILFGYAMYLKRQ